MFCFVAVYAFEFGWVCFSTFSHPVFFPACFASVGSITVAAIWHMLYFWHFRHLWGSCFILLAHVHFAAIIMPSQMLWFVASVVVNLAMMCADFCPLVCLCMGFIHCVEMSDPVRNLESHYIFWSSARASGEWLSGTYSTITDTVWSLMIDVPLNFLRNCCL